MNLIVRNSVYVIATFCTSLIVLSVFIVHGQNIEIQSIPEILQQKCLFEDKYIDSCPEYREELASINTTLYTIWSQQEENALSKSDMLQTLEQQKQTLQTVDIVLFQQGTRTENKEFLIQYMLHIIQLYREEIEEPGNLQGSLETLFSNTYFNQQQDGIVITSIELQSGDRPVQQFDPFIPVRISMRNFTETDYTDIEDIYCFARTREGEDNYIFPLRIPVASFEKNRIKHININITTEDKSMMDMVGEQTLRCTMVYRDQEYEYYSPYFRFDFMINPA